MRRRAEAAIAFRTIAVRPVSPGRRNRSTTSSRLRSIHPRHTINSNHHLMEGPVQGHIRASKGEFTAPRWSVDLQGLHNSHSRRVELRLFANQEEDVGMQSVEFTYAPEKVDDRRLFRRLRRAYRTRMLKWWMRYHLSFKTLKVIVPVQVSCLLASFDVKPHFEL